MNRRPSYSAFCWRSCPQCPDRATGWLSSNRKRRLNRSYHSSSQRSLDRKRPPRQRQCSQPIAQLLSRPPRSKHARDYSRSHGWRKGRLSSSRAHSSSCSTQLPTATSKSRCAPHRRPKSLLRSYCTQRILIVRTRPWSNSYLK